MPRIPRVPLPEGFQKVEAFNPSSLSAYEFCPFYFYVQHELGMMPKTQRVQHFMMFGSLFHEGAARFDINKYNVDVHGLPRVQETPEEAILRVVRETKLSPTYHVDDDELLSWLAVEATFCMTGATAGISGGYQAADGQIYRPEITPQGGYYQWRTQQNWDVVSIEKRYKADLGSAIIAPMPDGVVRSNGDLYILERKTSMTSWEPNYKAKFRLQFQTTLEVMAVERYYDEPVVGVLLTPIFYTRKKSKFWNVEKVQQPLHKVTLDPPRPIAKKNAKIAAEHWFDNFTLHELPWRRRTKCWQQRFSNCHGFSPCNFHDLCWGGQTLHNDFIEVKKEGWPDALYKEVQKHLWS